MVSSESSNSEHIEIIKQGVDAWNRWRLENPDVAPDLCSAELTEANLSGANLDNASLKRSNLSRANLQQASLEGALLIEATLTGADLSGANLRTANLEGAHLNGTKLQNADLRAANLTKADLAKADLDDALLRDGNLRNAHLQDVTSLNVDQLGATEITGATLPPDIQKFDRALDVASQAAKSAHALFITLMIACFYCWITIGTTTDAALLDRSASAELPIIQAPVPFTLFYIVAPILLSSLYVYMHLYLQRLWEVLASLPAILPDGCRPSDQVSPWLLGGLVRRYFPRLKHEGRRLGLLQSHVPFCLAWLVTPATVLLFWFRYIPIHDWMGTTCHIVLSALLVAFAYLFYNEMAETLCGVRLKRGIARALEVLMPFVASSGLIFFMLLYLSYLQIDGKHPRPAFLAGAELSKKPPNWDPMDPNQTGVKRARLKQADLRNAIADGAFLARADLLGADMRDAHLWHADLRKAILVRANLDRAILFEADLRGARLDYADLHLAQLGDAQLSHAELTGADLRGAVLDGANLRGANLFRARLDGAKMSHYTYIRFGPTWNVLETGTDLTEAILDKASFIGVDLRDANLSGASLSETDLSFADLSNANLSNANLNKANLNGTDLSGILVTETTDFNDVCVDPNTLFERVELTDEHRRQIWGPK